MKPTRLITEGAVLLALYAVLLLASLYMPVLGAICIFALPLPFLIFSIRYQLSSACMLLGAAILVTLIVSSPLSIANTLMFGITGIILGHMYKKKKSVIEILMVGTLVYLVSFVLLYIVSVQFFNIDIVKQMQDMFKQSMEQSEKFMKMAGASVNEGKLAELKKAVNTIGVLLPTVLAMASLFSSWITILIANRVLKRLKYTAVSWPKFRDIQIPKSVVWLYVVIILLGSFTKIEAGSYVEMVFLNLSTIFTFLLLLQGFSFLAFFTNAKGYTKAVPILTFVVGLFVPVLFPLMTILGIIDLGFSLRSKVQVK
ncbi:YybS family protein [Bacillus sp. WLY-B-L8]|uniref:YybS family protein n=1 Tax=Bacillus multifaciens TaxID=3068506 RepID=UPI00274237F5|nr:YybS family protein [Bacillus sp. WLY-B-L8]MDP7979172.1 YybS family protein [Bacillus sp. WLY-B-L8]